MIQYERAGSRKIDKCEAKALIGHRQVPITATSKRSYGPSCFYFVRISTKFANTDDLWRLFLVQFNLVFRYDKPLRLQEGASLPSFHTSRRFAVNWQYLDSNHANQSSILPTSVEPPRVNTLRRIVRGNTCGMHCCPLQPLTRHVLNVAATVRGASGAQLGSGCNPPP